MRHVSTRPFGTLATVLLAAGLMGHAVPSHALGGLILLDAPPASDQLSVGGTLWATPRYPGSSRTHAFVLPAIDWYQSNGLFVSTNYGVGWNFSQRKDLRAGVRLWPTLKRDGAEVPGLDTIGTRVEAAGFLNYAPTSYLLLQSGLRYGSGRDRDGALLELGATSGLPLPGNRLLAITAGVTWANQAYRDSYFGVTPQAALSSGLPATRLGSGWQEFQLALSTEEKLGDSWRLSGQLSAAWLQGSAARSPVTHSRAQPVLSLTLWRDFGGR